MIPKSYSRFCEIFYLGFWKKPHFRDAFDKTLLPCLHVCAVMAAFPQDPLRRRPTLPADAGCYQRCGQTRLPQRAGGCFSQVYSDFLCSSNPLGEGIWNLSEAAPVLSCWEETACYEYIHTEWASWIENRTSKIFFFKQSYSQYILHCIWAVLVCWGCHYKVLWSGWLKQGKFAISQFEG